MKYLKLLLLIGLSLSIFSCDNDDETAPQDGNPIYFSSSESIAVDSIGDVSLQFNFDNQTSQMRIVAQIETSEEDIPIELVFDFTMNATSNSRSSDLKYTINIDKGSTYTQDLSLKTAAGCIPAPTDDVDPDFGNGVVDTDIVLTDFIQWDSSVSLYYIDSEDLLQLLGFDPGFGNGGNTVYPKIWQETSGSIKGCSELPTLL